MKPELVNQLLEGKELYWLNLIMTYMLLMFCCLLFKK